MNACHEDLIRALRSLANGYLIPTDAEVEEICGTSVQLERHVLESSGPRNSWPEVSSASSRSGPTFSPGYQGSKASHKRKAEPTLNDKDLAAQYVKSIFSREVPLFSQNDKGKHTNLMVTNITTNIGQLRSCESRYQIPACLLPHLLGFKDLVGKGSGTRAAEGDLAAKALEALKTLKQYRRRGDEESENPAKKVRSVDETECLKILARSSKFQALPPSNGLSCPPAPAALTLTPSVTSTTVRKGGAVVAFNLADPSHRKVDLQLTHHYR